MKRIFWILGGAAAYFIWQTAAWMVFPFHERSIKTVPNEAFVMDALRPTIRESGFYLFPSHFDGTKPLDEKEWGEKYLKGPTGVLVYGVGGKPAMSGRNFVVGILSAIFLSGFCLLVLNLSRDRVMGYVPRVLFVIAMGLATWVTSHLAYWNWMNFPWETTSAYLIDAVGGFAVMGLVLAAAL